MMSILFNPIVSSQYSHEFPINSLPVIEVVLFETNPEYSIEQVKEALSLLNETIKLYKGFIERITASNNEGKYIDILYWKDMECAKQAAEDIIKHPMAIQAFKVIKPESVQILRYESFNSFQE